MASIKVSLVVIVFICSNCTSVHPDIDKKGWRIDIYDCEASVGGSTDLC